jgi:type II secretory pathway predicted ATPase ExeA
MFEHHFGLRENPFAAGHHAKFVFPSPEHQEAIAHLRYGIENREPFVLITGEVGTGKTTALFDALGEWQSRVEVALITNSALSRNELLEEIALRFGVPISGPTSKPQILAHLERVLAEVYARGDRAILLLDEAQNLERELLEEIRLLSNLERDGTKLLQVFLVGQPELEDKLGRAELRQLRQRITVHYRLQPLSAEDTERYIQHRIMVAGGHAASIFPTKACLEVFRITHGIPREINSVSSQALLNAFVDDARAVAPSHVISAAAELEFQSVLDRAEPRSTEPQAVDAQPLEPTRTEARSVEAPRMVESAPTADSPPLDEGEPAREDIDFQMIETWMAELSRNKQGAAPSAPTPASPSATARAASRPAVPPPPIALPTASAPPPPPVLAPAPPFVTPMSAASAPRRERREAQSDRRVPPSVAAGAPRRRDLAEEQRAALPPRLRAKLDAGIQDGAEDDFETTLPSSRGRGLLLVALVGVALVVSAIMVVRFGLIPGLPFMPASPARAPAIAPAPPVPVLPAPVDSASQATATDSLTRVTPASASAAPEAGAPKATTPSGAEASKPSGASATQAAKPAAGALAASEAAAKPSTPAAAKPETPPAAKPAGATAAAVEKPATPAAAAAAKPVSPATKPSPSSSMFGIAVATYLNSDRAEAERAKLAASTNLPVRIQPGTEGGTSVYHLVLGGFDSRASAEVAASELVRKGLVEEARIVPEPKVAKR